MSDTTDEQNSDRDDNPFATSVRGDQSVLPWLHTVSLVTSVFLGLFVAAIGTFVIWEGCRHELLFNFELDLNQSMLSQLSGLQFAMLLSMWCAVIGFAVFIGLRTQGNIERQVRRNLDAKRKRQQLEDTVAAMHKAVKENAKKSRDH